MTSQEALQFINFAFKSKELRAWLIGKFGEDTFSEWYHLDDTFNKWMPPDAFANYQRIRKDFVKFLRNVADALDEEVKHCSEV